MQKKPQMKKLWSYSTYSRLKTVKNISKYKFWWSQLEQFPLSVCFLVAVFLFLFFFFPFPFSVHCGSQSVISLLCLPYSPFPSSQPFSVCAVIYLAVALEVMIVYIQGGTILNTHNSDCLPILRDITAALSPPPSAPPSPRCPFPARLAVECQPPGPLVVANQFHQRGSKTN